ncbi:MAG TPA: YggS family pyridoxal phosphate-dependent enzyme [Candidatus Dormibacteraeota bacterium]
MRRSSSLAERLGQIRRRIEAAGGDPARIEIVAITKGRSLADCESALEAGLANLGENRVQEALPKLDALPAVRWHLVGHLQTNKVRQLAGRFALIQSLDSLHLAKELARRSEGTQPVLLQVNVSREPQKHGFAPEEAVSACREVARILDLHGVMGMAAAEGDPRPAFDELRRLRDEAEQALGRSLPVLSMGMTGDFEAAVAAGSTMLRLGRALFG